MKNTQNYEDFKRDLAVRILRNIFSQWSPAPDTTAFIPDVVKALDEFLPKDDSAARGHTQMVDLACVYEVDECPNCGKEHVQYSDAYEFCNECGYTFN
jgi:hypothetical protein